MLVDLMIQIIQHFFENLLFVATLNQISSLASTYCKAQDNHLRAMITHKTYKILNEYFVNILDFVEILESQFCSPWSDLSFDSIDNIEKNSSTILFIKKKLSSSLFILCIHLCFCKLIKGLYSWLTFIACLLMDF